jgi:hypothetical protein
MISRRHFLAGGLGTALLPLPAYAQAQWGVVRDLIGDVTLNGFPVTRQTALQPGQTLVTGRDGNIRFTIGSDAFFLRPNSRLRLDGSRPSEPIADFFRLVTGALGATFQRGMQRSIVTPTSTIGIRGTGVYIESGQGFTYACTCFGTTEVNGSANERVSVSAQRHEARLIRTGMPIARASFERHADEEIAALEALVGRPDPFRS